ncbi:MAG: inorganic phosphate transporter [Succinivibrio sp.]|nr:inorganic phosphate transporter [Succinivibrio sp.]
MLLILSALDLFVGVSNDAANFLNSAVGCRIAPLGVVLLVACLGVLLGATFSSGMMEVARKGMFHPEMFNFSDIMLVFAAVMISDVILLNIFNSFGLPTSTTVSVVFELLGSAVFASFFILQQKGLSYSEIFDYIKLDRTATIVTAILTSVAIAFVCGMAVQFCCRVLFSFRFSRPTKYLGGIFTGLSLTAISYFLIIKGAKSASFMQPSYIAFIDAHIEQIIWGSLAFFTVLGQIMALFNLNIFRLIILSGTFALAFSFAGNDLVNFVGVPLAALDSYLNWQESGVESIYYAMDCLNEDSRTSTIWLFLAGLIMSITLCTSKKARQVVQTSINLSTSTRGEREQFGASFLGRVITRMGLGVSRFVYGLMPKIVLKMISRRYRKAPVIKGQVPLPFDYVRASVNLVLASALISVATSYKLPLSTTYVTFMVAMGSSFADGAWDRESAVYRISGVVTVVAGWFLTGICAFTNAFFIAFILFNLGIGAALVLICVVIGVVAYTNFIRKPKADTATGILTAQTDQEILEIVTKAVPNFYAENVVCLQRALGAFFEDNEFQLRKARNKASNIQEAISEERSAYYGLALDTNYGPHFSLMKGKEGGGTIDAKFFFYLVFSNMREAAKSVRYALDQGVNHVANRHTIFGGEMKRSLFDLYKRLERIREDMQLIGKAPNAENVEAMIKHSKKLNRDIDKYQLNLVSIIGRERVSMHSSEIYLTFLQAMRDLANRYVAVSMQERALAELVANNAVMTPIDTASLQTEVMPAAFNSNGETLVKQATNEERDEEAYASALSNSAISLPKSPAALERSAKDGSKPAGKK